MPYANYAGFGQAYFEGQDAAGGESFGFRDHRHYGSELLDYSAHAAELDAATGPRKALVVGCGYGFAVRYLVEVHGWSRAYGMDISEFAIQNALPSIADRIYQGDARVQADYDSIASAAQGPPRWDGLYSEFLLEHFTDEEAVTICDTMRTVTDGPIIHRIWSGTGDPREDDWFNTKTVAEWQALVGTFDRVDWIDHDRPEDNTI